MVTSVKLMKPLKRPASRLATQTPRPLPASLYRLKITLTRVEPAIWRRVQVPGDITLKKLHRVIQSVMGWRDSHLHQYIIDGQVYSLPEFELDREGDIEVFDESRIRLKSLAKTPGSTFVYEYDLGDNWQHEITVEEISDVIECLAGGRACPPEDCGVWGYEELLETLANPRHEDYTAIREWVGDGFDAESFDRDMVNHKLKGMR